MSKDKTKKELMAEIDEARAETASVRQSLYLLEGRYDQLMEEYRGESEALAKKERYIQVAKQILSSGELNNDVVLALCVLRGESLIDFVNQNLKQKRDNKTNHDIEKMKDATGVRLISYGERKIMAVKLVRDYTGMVLKEAVEFVNTLPGVLYLDTKERCEEMYRSFRDQSFDCELVR